MHVITSTTSLSFCPSSILLVLLTLVVFSYSEYYAYDNVYNSEKNITIRKAKEKETHIIDDDPDWSSFYK